MKRTRVRLRYHSTTFVPPIRSKHYYNVRLWLLHELRILRAKRRVSGLNTLKEIKTAQRALVKVREEEHV